MSSLRGKELKAFQREVSLRFRDLTLLNKAFSHRSHANEKGKEEREETSNERLEFLGDSVLGLVVADYLYRNYPDKKEGELSRIRSVVVSEGGLSTVARRLGIRNYLLVGKGEEVSGGRDRAGILSDCLEAIIGALYLDRGLRAVETFIHKWFLPEIDKVLEGRHTQDFKSLLQEYSQGHFRSCPLYEASRVEGPDHDKTFWIEVEVGERVYGPGKGKSRRQAEQEAAKIAYRYLIREEECS